MAINKELWLNDFAANLYYGNPFFTIGKNWSSFVLGSKTHIPQAVASTSPVKITNATSLPISTSRITFDDLEFTNEMLVSPPEYVTNIDASEASFDTRSETMKNMVEYLKQAINIEIMDKWATLASDSVLRTTGTTTRLNHYGQAGVKALTMNDILLAKALVSKQNANINNLYLIIDPFMYNDVINIGLDSSNVLKDNLILDGFIGTIAGVKVIVRTLGNPFIDDVSTGLAKPTTLLYTDAYDATHFSGALMVDASKVGYALGTKENGQIRIGVKEYETGIYSDVIQAHTRVGASTFYKEASNIVKGVVSIIETV